MATMPDMNVRLHEMPTERHFELDAAFIRDALAGLPMRAALERPADDPAPGKVRVDIDLYSESGNVFVRGRIEGWVEVACSRCVEAASVAVDEDLAITYLPAAKAQAIADEAEEKLLRAGDEPATAEIAEAADVYPMAEDEVDLAPMLREQVILAVPFAPLCDEVCRGLCPRCGENRNRTPCDCPTEVTDPRWAALTGVKVDNGGRA
ncbi:MAG TPA: DUF177 domain-containing protein [Kofleriaceae bacterium]|nr:DUF177 domain-containing protein [Kofleriaceae bacterium]